MSKKTNAETAAETKADTKVTVVKMTDGREVSFAGKRKVLKETLIDASKIVVEGDVVQLSAGAISTRFSLRDGSTKTFQMPVSLIAQFAGHGAEQKYGDELATTKDKPLSEADMLLALEDLDTRIQAGDWKAKRESSGVSGASTVILAIMEATGKDQTTVRNFLQKKLDSDPALTRAALYASFRTPNSKTGQIIARMEAEKAAKAIPALNADAELEGI